MFTADTDLQIRAGLAAFLDRVAHQFADALAVKVLERVLSEDALVNVFSQEAAFGIVTGVTEGHLGQVVGTEGEELGNFGDLTGGHSGARDLDHGTEHVVNFDTLFGHDLFRDLFELRLDVFQFVDGAGQRDHDFRMFL